MITPRYSPLIDRYIYGVSPGCTACQEWVDLAFAALDQAGLSERHYRALYAAVDAAFNYKLRETPPFEVEAIPQPSQTAQRALENEKE